MNRGEINKLLLIVVNELSAEIRERIEEKKKQLNFELILWDINNLIQIFSNNEKLFVETYNNSYLEKREKYIEQLIFR